jgi:hypothetical protein
MNIFSLKVMNKKPSSISQNGAVIASILIMIVFLGSFVYGLMSLANSNVARARQRLLLLQAQYAAESAADIAIANLNSDSSYGGAVEEVIILETNSYSSAYSVSVSPGADEKERIITATGLVYTPASSVTPTYSRTIEVTAQRTSETASQAMVSRNIIDVHSGVKSIYARDIYVNGYIWLNRNTTDLIAETITVADKNTGAANCSIGGSGNLIKPTSFSDPSQTRTRIRTAYNNCISPPGNTSNTNFEVFANQNNVPKIQSTFIPWDDVMDGTYTNSPTGCNDWTTGGAVRSIPSTAGSKQTHYPDAENGVISSCGVNGNINLGSNQYNITDHVHIRADLCSASACTPTFYNPDSDIRFIFVEGSINFNRLTAPTDSGPIVFVSYGSDPPSKNSVCPYGGSIFLGNNGNTSASSVYLLANNGLCLDRTRFGTDPALGGLSGKNIYIRTNPGTPFDLALDPLFPVEEIPVDLSWRAVRFRRI